MKVLVTGGGGFLGQAIVRRLLDRGDSVVSYSRGDYPELRALGAVVRRGDVADLESLARAADGADVVFHVAAKPGIWGDYEDYRRANVTGSENVVAVCRRHGIRRLVHTSSPSAVFTGGDVEGADESLPYPDHYEAHYPKTKALAERAVLAANGPKLATVALRPHLIWGPGDNHLLPRLAARARSGALRRIGPGGKKIDTVYVDNAADAHLLAADRLAPGSPVAGKAYFITNGEPVETWEFLNRFLAAAGAPPVVRSIPLPLAVAAGAVFETVYRALGIKSEPRLTRFLVRELATSHWYDISAARRDLGYEPAVSIDEGLRRLAAWCAAQGR